MIRILIAFLLSCSVAMAGQGMGPGPGVKAYTAGGTTTLAGDATDRSAGTDVSQNSGSNLCYSTPGYNGTSGTLRHGYLRTGAGMTAANLKMVVYYYTGSAWAILETSPAVVWSANSLMHFTFAGTNSVPAGTANIILGWIADGYANAKTGGGTWSWMERTDGSYASPPTALNPAGDSNYAGAEMEIYVTD